MSWCELVSARQQMASAAACFRSPRLRAAMSTWIEAVDALVAARERLGGAVRSFMSVSLRRALNTWLGLRLQRNAMRRAVLALTCREQRVGFSTWSQHAIASRAHRERTASVMRGAASALRARGVRVAMNSWLALVSARREGTGRRAVVLASRSALQRSAVATVDTPGFLAARVAVETTAVGGAEPSFAVSSSNRW